MPDPASFARIARSGALDSFGAYFECMKSKAPAAPPAP